MISLHIHRVNLFWQVRAFGSLCSAGLGQSDGFIVKYDSTGKEIWQKQFGTPDNDRIWVLEKDVHGNLYAAGNTYGSINDKRYGEQDMFIFKFDKNGNVLKSIILGTDSTRLFKSCVFR